MFGNGRDAAVVKTEEEEMESFEGERWKEGVEIVKGDGYGCSSIQLGSF